MSTDQLRCEIERQEKLVMALREKKACRDALIRQVQLLLSSSEPELFSALGSDARELMLAMKESAPQHATPTMRALRAVARDADGGAPPVFSEEMERRIMQEEEPPLQQERQQHSCRKKNRKRKNRRRGHKKENAVLIGGPCAAAASSALEEVARTALMVAVDALQLECKPHAPGGIPIWLDDAEVPKGQHDQQLRREECGGEEEEIYSDDFEAVSDLDCCCEIVKSP